jgi:site-specific recombinase XerD
MSKRSDKLQSAAARFDDAFIHARKKPASPGNVVPQLSSTWPQENVALLEEYQAWLFTGGTGVEMVESIYVPTAGYALSLNVKPYTEWDMETEFEFEYTVEYIRSRGLSAISTKICRNALEKFRQFLSQRRGQYEITFQPVNYERYCTGLPDWVIEQLERYQHLCQANWRPARLHQQAMRFWGSHTRLWRWLFEHYSIGEITDIKRQYILDYVDYRLTVNSAAKSINQELRNFRSFLLFLQDQGYHVTQALLRIPSLKEPAALPRFLTDEQVRSMRVDLEERVAQAQSSAHLRDARLDRAAFYLLWQGGLRLGEVEELRMEELDLTGRNLMVRQGKGRKDRAIYLTDIAVHALQEYLAVRGPGPTDHVFFYRHRPVRKDLIPARIKASGKRVGVAVSPHRLRHTCATQLLNAGCRVTSIQKFLGHTHIDTTMIYAQAHDQSVSDDYYAAMSRIEKRLEIMAKSDEISAPVDVTPAVRVKILKIADALGDPHLDVKERLKLVKKIRHALNGKTPTGNAM